MEVQTITSVIMRGYLRSILVHLKWSNSLPLKSEPTIGCRKRRYNIYGPETTASPLRRNCAVTPFDTHQAVTLWMSWVRRPFECPTRIESKPREQRLSCARLTPFRAG